VLDAQIECVDGDQIAEPLRDGTKLDVVLPLAVRRNPH
jgi:hypothetical protein